MDMKLGKCPKCMSEFVSIDSSWSLQQSEISCDDCGYALFGDVDEETLTACWNATMLESVVTLCLSNQELTKEFDRLNGTNLSGAGTPLDVKIDIVTGRYRDDVRKFIEFIQEVIMPKMEIGSD